MLSYQFDKFASVVAQAIEEHVAVDRILEVCNVPLVDYNAHTSIPSTEISKDILLERKWKIAVAQDAAFNFMYRENLARLKN